jgi:HD-like signal output (HDOD) protein
VVDEVTVPEPLEKLVRRIDRFPTIPEIALKVFRELSQDDFDLDRIADFISTDPLLAARIVKLSRSPIYGIPREDETLAHAILRIGAKETQNAVMAVGVMEALPETPKKFNISMFWCLGLASALSARQLAKDLGYPHPECAYLAGLVHMMGEAYLAIEFSRRYQKAVTSSEQNSLPLETSLEAEFGVGTPAVTGRVLRHWDFPKEVIEAVEHHLDSVDEATDNELAGIVFAADRICRDLRLAPPSPGYEDRAWASELPSNLLTKLLTLGYPDITYYLIEQREFLKYVEETARATFNVHN